MAALEHRFEEAKAPEAGASCPLHALTGGRQPYICVVRYVVTTAGGGRSAKGLGEE
jgi:hypothetical protein